MFGKDGVLQLLSAFGEGEEGEDKGDDEGGPEQGIGGSVQATLEREECGIKTSSTGDVIHPEKHPANHDKEES